MSRLPRVIYWTLSSPESLLCHLPSSHLRWMSRWILSPLSLPVLSQGHPLPLSCFCRLASYSILNWIFPGSIHPPPHQSVPHTPLLTRLPKVIFHAIIKLECPQVNLPYSHYSPWMPLPYSSHLTALGHSPYSHHSALKVFHTLTSPACQGHYLYSITLECPLGYFPYSLLTGLLGDYLWGWGA